ncbi:beta-1,6-N-acetylglucosaminyltransferase [Aestuariibius insulae]|uniref:DUF5927 domain-containing protein n=1 Tax=Aestuariibius insulae TaxID=2058287 RepID=UPI00345E132A
MTLGVVMLAHTAFDRVEQVVRHWSAAGCPVVLHIDEHVPAKTYDNLVTALSDLQDVRFSKRFRCEWGSWGLVRATKAAAAQLLAEFPEASRVYLCSGSCLPLRPIRDLQAYLDAHPATDFIESATSADVRWAIGGLDAERFTFRFPFSWRKQRRLFDAYVKLQRRLKFKRRCPDGIEPHLGSQWWCLTRQTLEAIFADPKLDEYDRFFRHVWIPDESYFQTLARRHSKTIESRSLTLSKFDFQGKPNMFYNDHLKALQTSRCFVARKIWNRADLLYDTFLAPDGTDPDIEDPRPRRLIRTLEDAVLRRTRGRPGLVMQSRHPRDGWENGLTAAPYSIFEGFTELFVDFEPWLANLTGCKVHGHLFAPDRVAFELDEATYAGALPSAPAVRDYDPEQFLRNLIWNLRGERQCFQYGPDDNPEISWLVAKDANAQISIISGAWAIPLFQSGAPIEEIRSAASRLQTAELEHLAVLKSYYAKARIRIWTLADFLGNPHSQFKPVIDEIAPRTNSKSYDFPDMVDLTGLRDFLQELRNAGMHPYLTGDIPADQSLQLVHPAQPSKVGQI